MSWWRPARWLLIGGLGIMAATLIGNHIVPLYDGLGFPDQPYQYAVRSEPSAPPAQPARQTVSKSVLDNSGVALQTSESGPQVKVVFTPGALRLSANATKVNMSAAPEVPSLQPGSGSISSNVYLISGTTSPGTPAIKTGLANISLRLPQNVSFTSPPVMIYRKPGGTWSQLPTKQTGADIYEAAFNNWGEYALAVNMRNAAPGTAGAKTTRNPALLVAALIIGLIAVILVAIRLRGPGQHDQAK